LSFDRTEPTPATGYRIADFDARRCKAFVAHLPVNGTYNVAFRVNEMYCPNGRLYQPNGNQAFSVAGRSFVAQAIGRCAHETPTGSFSHMSRSPSHRNMAIMQVVLYLTFITL
jgi:hypothetical protein